MQVIFQKILPYLFLILFAFYFNFDRYLKIFHIDLDISKYLYLIIYVLMSLLVMLFMFSLQLADLTTIYPNIALIIIGLIVVSIPFNIVLYIVDFSLFWVFSAFIIVVFNDSFAYFIGTFFGKHKLIEVSPKKTIEGFFGGLIFSVLAGFYLPLIFHKWTFIIARNPKPLDIFGNYPIPHEFVKQKYNLFGNTFSIYPAQFLTIAIALFFFTLSYRWRISRISI